MNTDTLTSGSTVKNHISLKNGIRIQCKTENFVPFVVLGLSTSSFSSLPSSTSMTPLRQEIDHPKSSSRSSTSPSMTSSTVSKVWIDKNGETCTGWITIPQSCPVNVWKGKNGETRTLLKRQKSCWLNQPKSWNQIRIRITSEYGKTRIIPMYRNGCKNSERILWVTEFLNAETHTQVLLMDYLQSLREVRIW